MPAPFTVSRPRPEITRVTFDNPPANLVDPAMIRELHALVSDLEADSDLRAVVFGSARQGRFLGPYDMSQAAQTPNEPGKTGLPMWLDLTVRLSQLPAAAMSPGGQAGCFRASARTQSRGPRRRRSTARGGGQLVRRARFPVGRDQARPGGWTVGSRRPSAHRSLACPLPGRADRNRSFDPD